MKNFYLTSVKLNLRNLPLLRSDLNQKVGAILKDDKVNHAAMQLAKNLIVNIEKFSANEIKRI